MSVVFATKNYVQDPAIRNFNWDGVVLPSYSTSHAALLTGSDFWRLNFTSVDAVLDVSQLTLTDVDKDAMGGKGILNALRLTYTSGSFNASPTHASFSQRIPIAELLNYGQPVSYQWSTWVRSSAQKRIGLKAVLNYGTGGSPSAQETLAVDQGKLLSGAATWDRLTLDMLLGDFLSKTLGSNMDAYIEVFVQVFYNDTSTNEFVGLDWSVGDTVDITASQFEAGSVTTPFEEEGPFFSPSFSARRLKCYSAPTEGSDVVNLEFLTGGGPTPIEFELLKFNIAPTAVADEEGELVWNPTDNTLDMWLSPNVTLQIGQETVLKAKNETGSTILNGKAVALIGADGTGRPKIVLANITPRSRAWATIGIATEDIANNGTGFVTVQGLVRGINTAHLAVGSSCFLNGSPGELTNVPPSPPNSVVHVAVCMVSDASVGVLYVPTVNLIGTLEELTDTVITTPATGDLMVYNASTSLWENGTSLVSLTLQGGSLFINPTGVASGGVARIGDSGNDPSGGGGWLIGSMRTNWDYSTPLATNSTVNVFHAWQLSLGATNSGEHTNIWSWAEFGNGGSYDFTGAGLNGISIKAHARKVNARDMVGMAAIYALTESDDGGGTAVAPDDTYGVYVQIVNNASFSNGDVYGVYVADPTQTIAIAGSKWGFYQAGTALANRFEGQTTVANEALVTGVFYVGSSSGFTSDTVRGAGILTSGTYGAATTNAGLEVEITNTSASGANPATTWGLFVSAKASGAATYGSPAQFISGYFFTDYGSSGNSGGSIYGVYSRAEIGASGGNMSAAEALRVRAGNGNAASTLTNAYGIYIVSTLVTGAVTNRWGIYQAGSNDKNFYAGIVYFGDSTSLGTVKAWQTNSATSLNSSTIYGTYTNLEPTPTVASTASYISSYTRLRIAGTVNCTGASYGRQVLAQYNGSATKTTLMGDRIYANKNSTGPITNLTGLRVTVGNQDATGAVTSAWGLYIDAIIATGTVTNKWGLYQGGTDDINFFAGLTLTEVVRGGIYQDNTAATTVLTLATTYYPILTTWTDGGGNGVTRTTGTGRLTPTQAGTYRVTYALGYTMSATNQDVRTAIMKNGSATVEAMGTMTRRTSGTTDRGSVSGICYVSLNGTTDYVQLAAENLATAATTLTVYHAQMIAERVGA
jgi:hypothetical protein